MIMSTAARMTALTVLTSGLLFLGFKGLTQIRHETASPAPKALTKTSDLEVEAQEPEVTQLASLSYIPQAKSAYHSDNKVTNSGPLPITLRHIQKANKFAEAQDFTAALEALDAVPSADKQDYAVVFLKARILSWSGNHSEAEQIFLRLTRQYPQDSDIAVSFAYLQYYQGKFDEAERGFSRVVARHPNYQGAILGLERVEAARAN